MLSDTDYKNIQFTRPDGVNVIYKVILNDPTNLDENFLLLQSGGIDTGIEIQLFYWLDSKRWTINELQYFALNNDLCMKISDKNNKELASYGTCSTKNRVFGHAFGYNFN